MNEHETGGRGKGMRRKIMVLVALTALLIGLSLFAVPSISRADTITITKVCVTIGSATAGSTTWGNVGGGCGTDTAHEIWNLGAVADGNSTTPNSVTLLAGQSLILTQTNGFNFDTSESHTNNAPCSPGAPCTTTLTVNALMDINGATGKDILANNNLDNGGTFHNEAANWSQVGVAPNTAGFGSVFFGYADNIHTQDCADSGNCLPDSGSTPPANLWQGNATYFIGAGTSGIVSPSVPQGGANHCSTTVSSDTCFDAGAIMIFNTQTAVPEPSSILLVGTVMMGLAAWGLKRARRTA